MDNLYILTKQEFTSLYRFGKIPLNPKKIIKRDKDIDFKIYDEFLSLPYFEGDEEYLIISFENSLIEDIWLEIDLVSEIIPLTIAAQKSYQMKFDIRLDFKDARYENIIHKVEEYIDVQERFVGAKAFWKLCRIQEAYKVMLKDELVISAYNKRINGIKSSAFSEEFFVHVLAYDRYEFFPNSDLGFYYDVGEIFAHSKGKPSFVGSNFHSFLENKKRVFQGKHFLELARLIAESNEIIKFTEQLTSNGLRQFIAAAIFLKFKSDLAERDTIKGSDTGYLVSKIGKDKNFIEELNLAIYLTGTFFGYKKFYDDLYELTDLKIFKSKGPKLKEVNKKEKDQEEIPLIEEYSSSGLRITGELISDEEQEETSEESDKFEDVKEEDALIDPPEESVSGKEIKDLANTPKEGKRNPEPETESSEIEEHIYNTLIEMLEEDKGSFEIKTKRLNELKKLLAPLASNKSISKKEEVIEIIRQNFHGKLNIKGFRNTYLLSRNVEMELFVDSDTAHSHD